MLNFDPAFLNCFYTKTVGSAVNCAVTDRLT